MLRSAGKQSVESVESAAAFDVLLQRPEVPDIVFSYIFSLRPLATRLLPVGLGLVYNIPLPPFIWPPDA